MVPGIESFRKAFAEFDKQYIIIGGTACDVAMEDAGLTFRATKDLDIILIVEALTPEFAKQFWEYIKEAGYEHCNRSTGKPQFYRFSNPRSKAYPKMIELFSRPNNDALARADSSLIPLHIDDEISSLSAILLNDEYYRFVLNGKMIVDGITILGAEHIIPMKMKAWLDLNSKSQKGIHVDSKNIKKHRLDVFRLFPLVREDTVINVSEEIYKDIVEFITEAEGADIDISSIASKRSKEYILDVYRNMYKIDVP